MRAINAFMPIVVLIVSSLWTLCNWRGENLTEIIGSANSYTAMLWASLLGAMVAAIMSITQKILTIHETVDAWFGGVKAMLFAMIILILAWALSDIGKELHTANYLISVLADTLPAQMVPVTVFIITSRPLPQEPVGEPGYLDATGHTAVLGCNANQWNC